MRSLTKFTCIVTGMVLSTAVALADFPDHTIEIVVPYKAGGETDIAARIFGQCLSKELGSSVRIKDIQGALSQNGNREVRNARPDGYTLLWNHQMLNMIKATNVADYNYQDFKPIISVVYENMGLFSAERSSVTDWESLQKKAVENPRNVSISFAFNGFTHFVAADFFDKTNINLYDLKTIPGGGAKDRIIKTIRGDFNLIPIGVSAALPYVQSGDLQAVAILSDGRDKTMPDALTAKEQGVDSVFQMRFVLFAPKDTSDERAQVIAKAAKSAVSDDMCVKKLNKNALYVDVIDGERLNNEMKHQVKYFNKLANKYNLGGK